MKKNGHFFFIIFDLFDISSHFNVKIAVFQTYFEAIDSIGTFWKVMGYSKKKNIYDVRAPKPLGLSDVTKSKFSKKKKKKALFWPYIGPFSPFRALFLMKLPHKLGEGVLYLH